MKQLPKPDRKVQLLCKTGNAYLATYNADKKKFFRMDGTEIKQEPMSWRYMGR